MSMVLNGQNAEATFVYVAYVDEAYGGPEEGGWYYDTSVPLVPGDEVEDRLCQTYMVTSDDDCAKTRDMLQELVNAANVGRYKPSSAASRGDYLRVMVSSNVPMALPTERPWFE